VVLLPLFLLFLTSWYAADSPPHPAPTTTTFSGTASLLLHLSSLSPDDDDNDSDSSVLVEWSSLTLDDFDKTAALLLLTVASRQLTVIDA
jgi:hypothetical protein